MKRRTEDTPGHAWSALMLAALVCGATTASADSIPVPPAESAPDSAAMIARPAIPAPAAASAAPSTPNPRSTVFTRVRLDRSDHNVARSGPGDAFSIAGVYGKGATFTVIAKSRDWYNVQLSDTETGWFHASLCKEFDDLSGLEFRPNPRLYTRTGAFVAGVYGGGYAFDRKSNSMVLGGRLGYYVFDRLQAEAGGGWTHVRRPAEIVESLFGLTLEAEDFHMAFYNFGLTFELLPGRQMVPYVTAGVGSSIMVGRTEASYNYGAGTTLFISKRSALRWEIRNYHFNSGDDDSRVSNDNIEFTLGTSFLF